MRNVVTMVAFSSSALAMGVGASRFQTSVPDQRGAGPPTATADPSAGRRRPEVVGRGSRSADVGVWLGGTPRVRLSKPSMNGSHAIHPHTLDDEGPASRRSRNSERARSAPARGCCYPGPTVAAIKGARRSFACSQGRRGATMTRDRGWLWVAGRGRCTGACRMRRQAGAPGHGRRRGSTPRRYERRCMTRPSRHDATGDGGGKLSKTDGSGTSEQPTCDAGARRAPRATAGSVLRHRARARPTPSARTTATAPAVTAFRTVPARMRRRTTLRASISRRPGSSPRRSSASSPGTDG